MRCWDTSGNEGRMKICDLFVTVKWEITESILAKTTEKDESLVKKFTYISLNLKMLHYSLKKTILWNIVTYLYIVMICYTKYKYPVINTTNS